MANKPRAIGTAGENMVVARLEKIFGVYDEETGTGVHRRSGNTAARDIFGTPFPVEVKRTEKWTPQAWALKMTKHHANRWALYMMPRDQRRSTAPPQVVMLPADLFEELLVAWQEGP